MEPAINFSLALAAGHLQTVISILHKGLVAFVSVQLRSLTTKKKKKKKGKKLDFASLLKCIKEHWDESFSTCDPQLKVLVDRALLIRNKVSHQNISLEDYHHSLQTLEKLAKIVGCNRGALDTIQQAVIAAVTVSEGPQQGDTSVALGGDWKSWKDKGNTYFKQGKCTEALNCYTKAIQIAPKVAVLYSNRAICELRLHKFELAREDAEDAMAMNKTNVKYYRLLSEALVGLNLYDEATAICLQGLKLSPRDETLLLRKRDCGAHITIRVANGMPRQSVEDLDQKALLAGCSKLISNLKELKPKPSDIKTLDLEEFRKMAQLSKLVMKAHGHLNGIYGLPKDSKLAADLYEQAGKAGSAEGWYNLSILYWRGQGVARDFVRDFECLEKAAGQKPFYSFQDQLWPNIGVAEAENGLGICYRDGIGIDPDAEKAFHYFLRSAEHGCPEGQNNTGLYLLQTGKHALARTWYQKAADQGIAEAQMNYADLLRNGMGGPEDSKAAYNFYKKAASQGLAQAMKAVQDMERSGAVGAFPLSGGARANPKSKGTDLLLGMNYLNGEGGYPKDLRQAEKYLRAAAKAKDDLGAQEALGNLLLELKKNQEAFLWIQKAADKGRPAAQYNLGRMYAYGHGCVRDEDKALRWLRRSMTQAKDPEDRPEKHVQSGKTTCDFEQRQGLTDAGLSILERRQRYIALNAPNEQVKQALNTIFDVTRNMNAPSAHDVGYMKVNSFNNVTMWTEMEARAAKGSRTALRFLKAHQKVAEACIRLKEYRVQEALAFLRDAFDLWDLVSIPSTILPIASATAQMLLSADPTNADALLTLGVWDRARSATEEVVYWKQCVALQPRVAVFHFLLGSTYAMTQQYTSALRELDRALELSQKPEWLYSRATLLRLSSKPYEEQEKGYQLYLSSNPRDEKKRPEAHYSLGMLYFTQNKYSLAKEQWELGQAAEEPSVRLPCLEPLGDNFPCKRLLHLCLVMHQSQPMPRPSPPRAPGVTKCEFCACMVKSKQLASHKLNKCPKRPVPCQTCTMIVPFEKMSVHAKEHVSLAGKTGHQGLKL